MTVLLVDVGNSRVKWACCERGVLGAQRAADHASWTADDWRAMLFADAAVERVVAASVAGGASLAVFDAPPQGSAPARAEKYRNLAVRVSGYSQRFCLLDRKLQDHIIARTKHARV